MCGAQEKKRKKKQPRNQRSNLTVYHHLDVCLPPQRRKSLSDFTLEGKNTQELLLWKPEAKDCSQAWWRKQLLSYTLPINLKIYSKVGFFVTIMLTLRTGDSTTLYVSILQFFLGFQNTLKSIELLSLTAFVRNMKAFFILETGGKNTRIQLVL